VLGSLPAPPAAEHVKCANMRMFYVFWRRGGTQTRVPPHASSTPPLKPSTKTRLHGRVFVLGASLAASPAPAAAASCNPPFQPALPLLAPNTKLCLHARFGVWHLCTLTFKYENPFWVFSCSPPNTINTLFQACLWCLITFSLYFPFSYFPF